MASSIFKISNTLNEVDSLNIGSRSENFKKFISDVKKNGYVFGEIDFSQCPANTRNIWMSTYLRKFEDYLKSNGEDYVLDVATSWNIVARLTDPVKYFPGLLSDERFKITMNQMVGNAIQQLGRASEEEKATAVQRAEAANLLLEAHNNALVQWESLRVDFISLTRVNIRAVESLLAGMSESIRKSYSDQTTDHQSSSNIGINSFKALRASAIKVTPLEEDKEEVVEEGNAYVVQNAKSTVNPTDAFQVIKFKKSAGSGGKMLINPFPNAMELDKELVVIPSAFARLYQGLPSFTKAIWCVTIMSHLEDRYKYKTDAEKRAQIAHFEASDQYTMKNHQTIEEFLVEIRSIITATYSDNNLPPQSELHPIVVSKLICLDRFRSPAEKLHHKLTDKDSPFSDLHKLSLDALFKTSFGFIDKSYHEHRNLLKVHMARGGTPSSEYYQETIPLPIHSSKYEDVKPRGPKEFKVKQGET